MKNLTIIVIIIITVLVSNCLFAGGVPKCSDQAAKEQVCERFRNNVWLHLYTGTRMAIVSDDGKKRSESNVNSKHGLTDDEAFNLVGNQTALAMSAIVIGSETYQDFRKSQENNQKAIKMLDDLNSRVWAMKFSVSGTKMEWKDSSIGKCICSGSITNGSVVRKVIYSVQYDDDGKIVVDNMEAE